MHMFREWWDHDQVFVSLCFCHFRRVGGISGRDGERKASKHTHNTTCIGIGIEYEYFLASRLWTGRSLLVACAGNRKGKGNGG